MDLTKYRQMDRDEMAPISLFVSILPCSQLISAEPFRDEKRQRGLPDTFTRFAVNGSFRRCINEIRLVPVYVEETEVVLRVEADVTEVSLTRR